MTPPSSEIFNDQVIQRPPPPSPQIIEENDEEEEEEEMGQVNSPVIFNIASSEAEENARLKA